MVAVKRHNPLFLSLCEDLLVAGCCVRFRAEGTSMRPAIEDGDTLTIGPARGIQPGDVVLYRRGRRLLAHRVLELQTGAGGAVTVVTRGDGKSAPDAPVPAHAILGTVRHVERGADVAPRRWRAALPGFSRLRLRLEAIACTIGARAASHDPRTHQPG